MTAPTWVVRWVENLAAQMVLKKADSKVESSVANLAGRRDKR